MLKQLKQVVSLAALVSLAAAAAPGSTTRTYDIADLLFTPLAAGPMPAPNADITQPAAKDPAQVDVTIPLDLQPNTLSFLASVRQLLAATPDAKVELVGTDLKVTALAADHQAVSRLFAAGRAARTQVAIETRFLSLDAKTLQTLPQDLRETLAAAAAFRTNPTILSAEQVQLMLAAAKLSGDSSIAQAPRVTVYSNQSSRILVGEYQFFASSYTPDLTPVTTSVFAGISTHLTALAPPPDTTATSLHVSLSESAVASVASAPWPQSPAGQNLTTQTPTAKTDTWQGLVTLPKSQSAVVCLRTSPTSSTYVIMTASPSK